MDVDENVVCKEMLKNPFIEVNKNGEVFFYVRKPIRLNENDLFLEQNVNKRSWSNFLEDIMTTELALMYGLCSLPSLKKGSRPILKDIAKVLNFYFENNRTNDALETARRRMKFDICSQVQAQSCYNFYIRAVEKGFGNYKEAVNCGLPWNANISSFDYSKISDELMQLFEN